MQSFFNQLTRCHCELDGYDQRGFLCTFEECPLLLALVAIRGKRKSGDTSRFDELRLAVIARTRLPRLGEFLEPFATGLASRWVPLDAPPVRATLFPPVSSVRLHRALGEKDDVCSCKPHTRANQSLSLHEHSPSRFRFEPPLSRARKKRSPGRAAAARTELL